MYLGKLPIQVGWHRVRGRAAVVDDNQLIWQAGLMQKLSDSFRQLIRGARSPRKAGHDHGNLSLLEVCLCLQLPGRVRHAEGRELANLGLAKLQRDGWLCVLMRVCSRSFLVPGSYL